MLQRSLFLLVIFCAIFSGSSLSRALFADTTADYCGNATRAVGQLLATPSAPASIPLRGLATKDPISEVSKSYFADKAFLLDEIELLYLLFQKELANEVPADLATRDPELSRKLIVSRLTSAGILNRVYTRHSDTQDASYFQKLEFLIQAERKDYEDKDSPLRSEIRFRMKKMMEAQMDWPHDPKILQHFGLKSPFAYSTDLSNPQFKEAIKVEEYLRYQEILYLNEVLQYLRFKLQSQGISAT